MSEPVWEQWYVTSLSGYSEHAGGQAKPITTYQVLSRNYCHRLACETHSKRVAERVCEALNRGVLWPLNETLRKQGRPQVTR